MAMPLSNYVFDGLFTKPERLESASGVYAVFAKTGGHWNIVDVGESEDIRARVEDHDRRPCWERSSAGAPLAYAAYYCKDGTRQRVADEVRKDYGPPCGEK